MNIATSPLRTSGNRYQNACPHPHHRHQGESIPDLETTDRDRYEHKFPGVDRQECDHKDPISETFGALLEALAESLGFDEEEKEDGECLGDQQPCQDGLPAWEGLDVNSLLQHPWPSLPAGNGFGEGTDRPNLNLPAFPSAPRERRPSSGFPATGQPSEVPAQPFPKTNFGEGTSSEKGNHLSDVAKGWEGKSFKKGQDKRCADWVSTAIEDSGLAPEGFKHQLNVRQLRKYGKKVDAKNLQPGDIIYFSQTWGGLDFSHVGIYVGNGKFAHRGGGDKVKIDDLFKGKYAKHFEEARRLSSVDPNPPS